MGRQVFFVGGRSWVHVVQSVLVCPKNRLKAGGLRGMGCRFLLLIQLFPTPKNVCLHSTNLHFSETLPPLLQFSPPLSPAPQFSSFVFQCLVVECCGAKKSVRFRNVVVANSRIFSNAHPTRHFLIHPSILFSFEFTHSNSISPIKCHKSIGRVG